jgi:C4-dicarboxylate-specific signal transduction histidine kinase
LNGRSLRARANRRPEKLRLEERLRFETLLSELSAGLIHVPAAAIDAALERALKQVVTFLGVDRGTVDIHHDVGRGGRISWTLPRVTESPHVMDAEQFPWTAKQLGRGEIIRFSDGDELPEEAATDRASYARGHTRSKVALPLSAGGPMLGVLSFGSVRSRRTWPAELVERLRLLSEAFASTLERKRVELSLAERLRFEKLLSSLSTAFSQLSAGDFNREVQHALHRVADFLGVARGSLIEFSRDGSTAHSWAIEEWMDVDEFPWMTARLRRGDVVSFSEPETLPDEAAVDRQSYLAHRVKPQVAMPLMAGGTVVGGLVFSGGAAERSRAGELALMQQLQLLAEVFANALSRKQGELETQRLRQELTHIGRVSALGELTASLAHELNQPLSAILSNAETVQDLLAADVVDLGLVREILGDIVAEDKRAAAVIRRLRILLKKGEIEFVALDVNEIVGEVAWLVKSDVLNRNVSMSLELAPALPRVLGDRVQLQQVVLNLVLNGLEALRPPPAGPRTLVIRTAQADAVSVMVAVQDSGIGIDETDPDRIFQPLYTTKPDGLGMGLAIARTIVDAHGGRLVAANNERGGATVHFTLPVGRKDEC